MSYGMTIILDSRSFQKFDHPQITAKGETRASVSFGGMKTLWFNTGTLCNIACVNCYIESSPKNDRLVYLTKADVLPYLDELDAIHDVNRFIPPNPPRQTPQGFIASAKRAINRWLNRDHHGDGPRHAL